ncbi:hypothetical protein ACWEOZ_10785 [Actinoplanes sp. NPDC004185]
MMRIMEDAGEPTGDLTAAEHARLLAVLRSRGTALTHAPTTSEEDGTAKIAGAHPPQPERKSLR